MRRKIKGSDITILVIITVLMVSIFYWDISNSFSVSINDLLITGLFLFAIRVTFYNSTKGQYLLGIFILLALPGILTINFELGDTGTTSKMMANFGRFSFNPLSFLLLILYCFTNRANFAKLLFGSQNERNEKSDKAIEFYYTKFNNCSIDELNKAFNMFENYPEEAQIALRRIHQERNLSFLIV